VTSIHQHCDTEYRDSESHADKAVSLMPQPNEHGNDENVLLLFVDVDLDISYWVLSLTDSFLDAAMLK
jgi:hypothetical protein